MTNPANAPTLIEKTFDPAEHEARRYADWEANGCFRPARPDAEPITIVITPPNDTGSLHIGHALDNTLQDILIRWRRLQGRDARWVVGTDHAGIATQMVVERQLAEAGAPSRTAMGREAFVEKVWAWKAESGSTITGQLRRLGASCDWANERFTMDDGLNAAVTKVFVQLFKDGLLYRDKRLVNWDPKLGTAISDLEVEYREIDGHMWHFRYPLEDGSGFLAVATTRPETILGDGAVAVNPDDPRYAHLVGKRCRLPLVDRLIPIIADSYVEADFGSGAVKITAAHDFNDFEVYKRHPEANIPVINLMNPDATMADTCPPAYRGLTREAARQKVVADFDALGLLEKVEPHRHQVPYGDRSGVVIEPYLTDQWYVDAATLAGPALAAVRDGRTRFVPASWDKTYFNWLDNIQPWCVSRQLWWGHRIPAWYGPSLTEDGFLNYNLSDYSKNKMFVAENYEEALIEAIAYYRNMNSEILLVENPFVSMNSNLNPDVLSGKIKSQIHIWRDTDVLDTWFSSALWPFATLGWPEQTDDFACHYPGDVLVTGFDIIFFWVARMMMQGLHFTGEVPFHTVYCHGLVRDAKGQKMSKSKGNTVDPLTLIDRYGADALRFTMTAMETQGRDIKLDEKRIEGYRNFATKLWNAARFAQSNGISGGGPETAPEAQHPINRWIIGEVGAMVTACDAALEGFRFDGYADALYSFTWNIFCDWYLELTKPLLADGGDAALAEETRSVAGWALDRMLVALHPVMPFITEELWHKLASRDHDLILAAWPDAAAIVRDEAAKAEVDWLIGLVSEVRSARTELNVPPSARLGYATEGASAVTLERLAANAPAIERLARIAPLSEPANTGGRLQLVVGEAVFVLPLEGVIDLAAERARLEKARSAAEKERESLAGRLASPGFVERAKPEAIEKARADHDARAGEADRLAAALARLG